MQPDIGCHKMQGGLVMIHLCGYCHVNSRRQRWAPLKYRNVLDSVRKLWCAAQQLLQTNLITLHHIHHPGEFTTAEIETNCSFSRPEAGNCYIQVLVVLLKVSYGDGFGSVFSPESIFSRQNHEIARDSIQLPMYEMMNKKRKSRHGWCT